MNGVCSWAAGCAVVCAVIGLAGPSAADVTISASTNLAPEQSTLYQGENVIVDGTNTILTLQTNATYGTLQEYYFGTLTVTNGARVFCQGQGLARSDANARGIAIVATNVYVSTNGTISADGQGYPAMNGPSPGQSGSDGGGNHAGFGSKQNVSGTPYGSAANPVTLGSGGAKFAGNYGGGAIKVVVSGTFQLDGMLTACGTPDTGGWPRSGAGGSLWITGGGMLTGKGSMHAYGKTCGFGRGGGGRISIDDTINYQFTGNILTGIKGGEDGQGPGTLYLPSTARADFHVVTNQTLVVGGGPYYTNEFTNLTIDNGGRMEIGGVAIGLGTGSVIRSQNITIQTNGLMTANGFGFPMLGGPAPGQNGADSGGTHGGIGANNLYTVYGSATNPTSMGSGGKNEPAGGAIRLIVSGNLIVNGTLSADGKTISGWNSGAGGSIWISGGGTLKGNGAITARGEQPGIVAGGGGRIAIDDTVTYQFTGNILTGIKGACYGAGAGTLSLPSAARADFHVVTNQTLVVGNGVNYTNEFGNLTIDNGGTLEVSGVVSGLGSGVVIRAQNLTIRNGGVITANKRGFGVYGGGAGPAPGGSNIGGSHGGAGRNNATALYGSATNPLSAGSRGGSSGCYGAGAMRLIVANALVIDGSLTANGDALDSGGGSGGSMWIGTASIGGGGGIQANGGTGTYGGGGGRIAIYYRTGSLGGLPLPAAGLYTNKESISSIITVKGGYNVGADGPEDGSLYVFQATRGSLFFIY